jgi:hypothetical protein
LLSSHNSTQETGLALFAEAVAGPDSLGGYPHTDLGVDVVQLSFEPLAYPVEDPDRAIGHYDLNSIQRPYRPRGRHKR